MSNTLSVKKLVHCKEYIPVNIIKITGHENKAHSVWNNLDYHNSYNRMFRILCLQISWKFHILSHKLTI